MEFDMPEAEPRVSVLITCYNYEAYVAQAIDSVLAQTRQPDEILVVDDGSSDGSVAVIQGYGDKVRLLTQPNKGQIAATNHIYAHSSGDIVMFLDADDLLAPQAVADVLAHWQPGCAKLQYELDVIDGNGNSLGRRFCNYAQGYDGAAVRHEFERFGSYQWPVTSGNAYARSFLAQMMPLDVNKGGPDGWLNTVAPLYGEVVVVDRVLGLYRLHENNQSYQGTNSSSLGLRFSRRVDRRLAEIAFLEKHAARCAATLPRLNMLDQDLFMVNYRLMLQKLAEPYQTSEADTAYGVWRAGMRLLRTRAMPASRKLMHGAWLTALLLSPRWLARLLIRLRFARAELLQPLRLRRAAPAPQTARPKVPQ
jgi:glycosyltransferase involved in cell wall biosynthesis